MQICAPKDGILQNFQTKKWQMPYLTLLQDVVWNYLGYNVNVQSHYHYKNFQFKILNE